MRLAAAAASAAVLVFSGCGERGGERERLEVYAASSLTEAFTELEAAFEERHRHVDVALTFAGSQVLRVQIEQGARADVFASANPEHLEALAAQGLVGPGSLFAHNALVVIVPVANPAGIHSLADLVAAERLVIGTANVPVGQYTREMLRRAGAAYGATFEGAVLARVVSEETNVRLTRAKVELGEADAAVVYATDAAGTDRLRVVPMPPELDVRADYLVGVVEGSGRADLAQRFVDLLLSREGRAVLARHGFGLP